MKRVITLKGEFTKKPSKSIPKAVIKLAVTLEPREEGYATYSFGNLLEFNSEKICTHELAEDEIGLKTDESAESEYKNGLPNSERLHSLRYIV